MASCTLINCMRITKKWKILNNNCPTTMDLPNTTNHDSLRPGLMTGGKCSNGYLYKFHCDEKCSTENIILTVCPHFVWEVFKLDIAKFKPFIKT